VWERGVYNPQIPNRSPADCQDLGWKIPSSEDIDVEGALTHLP